MEDTPFTRFLVLARSHLLLVGVALIGCILIGIGVLLLLPKGEEEVITLEESEVVPYLSPTTHLPKQITIDVSGAVLKPGVYSLPELSRVQEAILAAGGLREDANQESISKNINLAQILTDGIKIYIPFVGEEALTTDGGVAGDQAKIIHLNSATLSELDSLPKVGAVTAQKIIDNRPYASLNELLTKKVVGNVVFSTIESLIAL